MNQLQGTPTHVPPRYLACLHASTLRYATNATQQTKIAYTSAIIVYAVHPACHIHIPTWSWMLRAQCRLCSMCVISDCSSAGLHSRSSVGSPPNCLASCCSRASTWVSQQKVSSVSLSVCELVPPVVRFCDELSGDLFGCLVVTRCAEWKYPHLGARNSTFHVSTALGIILLTGTTMS